MAAARKHLTRWTGSQLVHPSLEIPIPEVASDAMLKNLAALCAAPIQRLHLPSQQHRAAATRTSLGQDQG